MRNITIFAFDNAIASTITGPMDIFAMAGVMWNAIHKKPPDPYFQVEVVSSDGHPVCCANNISIVPHKSIDEVQQTDLVILPSVAGDIETVVAANQSVFPWLRQQNAKGALLASLCTGAFFLAEAGLLDNRRATTHWGFASLLKSRYPKVRIDSSRLLTRDQNIVCAAGSSAWCDACLHLIEKFKGRQVALECSKALLMDMSRSSQAPYARLTRGASHPDEEISQVEEWMEQNFQKKITIDELARRTGMSSRNFKRRFKIATGNPPMTYLQMLRVDAAKGFLEKTNRTVEEISRAIGYEDMSFFRKLFKRHTGLSPNSFRRKFAGVNET